MVRARNTKSKRTTTPSRSLFQSAPASVMAPRLMVILSAMALLILGLVMVYSSSSVTGYVEQGSAFGEMLKQVLFAFVGLIAALLIVVLVKQDFLRGTGGLIFWGVCVALLVLTSLLGTVGLGAKRWLIIGPISIQISEFAKIAFVLMAARIAEDYNEGALDFTKMLKQVTIFILLPLAFLFFTQSDLGTTLICCVALLVVLWLSGAPKKVLLTIMVLGIIAGVLAIAYKSYRSDRLGFFDPWADEQGSGYQLIRSFKAFAYGGLFGVGIGNSYEKLLYLPEAETDFIFAILGEELGLIGTVCVIALFLVFLRGGLLIASQARTPFGGLFAASLTAMVVFQAFLNIACVVGLMPTTGKPLPFISSGGSSLISSLVLVGFILSVSFDSHNEGQYRQRRENLRVVSAYSQPTRTGSPQQESPASKRMSALPKPGDRTPKRASASVKRTNIPDKRNNYSLRGLSLDRVKATNSMQQHSSSLLTSCDESAPLRVIRGGRGVSYEQTSRVSRVTRR